MGTIIVIIAIVGIVYTAVTKSGFKQENQAKKQTDKEKYMRLIEEGIKKYNVIMHLSKNQKFANYVCDTTPGFVRKGNQLMYALPIAAHDDTLVYHEEVYSRLQENLSELNGFWIDRTDGSESICNDIVEDYEYALMCSIGWIKAREEDEIKYISYIVTEEIEKRIASKYVGFEKCQKNTI